VWRQTDELNYFFVIASEEPVSQEAYSTSRDSAEAAVGQITSESPLPPGKHVATILGCSNIFCSNIVNIEWNRGRHYSQKRVIWVCGSQRHGFLGCFGLKVSQIFLYCSTVNVLLVIDLRLKLGIQSNLYIKATLTT